MFCGNFEGDFQSQHKTESDGLAEMCLNLKLDFFIDRKDAFEMLLESY